MKNIELRVKNKVDEIFKELDVRLDMTDEVIDGVTRHIKETSSEYIDDEELRHLIIIEMMDWDLI